MIIVANALSAVAVAIQRSDAFRHRISMEVEYAYPEFLQNRAEVSLFAPGSLRDTQRSRKDEESLHKGRSGVLDLLEAERTFSAALLNHRQALF
jgi:hypothetical protein